MSPQLMNPGCRIQNGPWTIGGLANHIWSVAGSKNRNDISSTFIQPFINYTTPTAVTYSLNTESSYDWKSEQWSIPGDLQPDQTGAMILQ